MRKGYGGNRWMTYRQAQQKGWQVRKAEKSTTIEFCEAKPAKEKGENGEEKDGSRLIHRTYAVFNAEQNRRHPTGEDRAAQGVGDLRGR
jgi:antirestriction protein ArdC